LSERTTPQERLYDTFGSHLIPVIPPGATIAPSSKITPESVGKIPGLRSANDLWVGFDWRKMTATIEDVRRWVQWNANIGVRTDHFPCIDIDCADASLAARIESIARRKLGPAPARVGNAPKCALAYVLAPNERPFGRLRLWIRWGTEKKYLVEVLGEGQQYVIHGVHPKTMQPYTWDREPVNLTGLTLEKARAFLAEVKEYVEEMGFDTEAEGDGRGLSSRPKDQEGLLAPSMEALREVVDLLPNDNVIAPGRNDWLRIGAAIKAAAGEEEEREAADLFVTWSMKWEGNDFIEGNDPDDARENFRRIKPPFAVGWPLLAEMAREHGYDDTMFEVDEEAPETTPTAQEPTGPKFLSDQWLAAKVVKALMRVLRYLPAKDQWLVWTGARWQPDAEMMAEDMIKLELRKIAAWVDGGGAAESEIAKAGKEARDICSSGKLTAVTRLVKSDRAIAVGIESLDHNRWILNTPGGIVDLKTGQMSGPDPDQLCTRSTKVTPQWGPHPLWTKFLEESTKGDVALQAYLKRFMGYCLTGSTQEHKFGFLYGEGGNGKGVFMNAVMGVLADYHKDSPMETFISSNNDRHPTELAALVGARLVTASETTPGKRWDTSKLKRLTGGDPITARAMREDFFTFRPHFKLLFAGNHKPDMRDVDEGMRRRTNLIPFTNKPEKRDTLLGEKLEAEYPQILAWMIDGCLEWQEVGLLEPESVKIATDEYVEESDPFGQWLLEATVSDPEAKTPLLDLYDSWREFANQHGVWAGPSNRLSSLLRSRGYGRGKDGKTRRSICVGLKLQPVEDRLKGLTAE
jgi:P4 family phage/plasmid primase-like protien